MHYALPLLPSQGFRLNSLNPDKLHQGGTQGVVSGGGGGVSP